MATILIVEDELLIAADIERVLRRLGYNPLEPVDNSEDALEVLSSQAVHLVLMDINIVGEKDGIATALQVRRQFNIPVVFLTARTDTPTLNRANVADPYGYITKPYSTDTLKVGVELALLKAYQSSVPLPAPPAELALPPAEKPENFIFVRNGARYQKVEFEDVLYFEAMQNYVQLRTRNDPKPLVFDSTLKDLENLLPPTFFKTHRSFIVNLSHVTAYEPGFVELGTGQPVQVQVSRTCKADLLKRLHLLG